MPLQTGYTAKFTRLEYFFPSYFIDIRPNLEELSYTDNNDGIKPSLSSLFSVSTQIL